MADARRQAGVSVARRSDVFVAVGVIAVVTVTLRIARPLLPNRESTDLPCGVPLYSGISSVSGSSRGNECDCTFLDRLIVSRSTFLMRMPAAWQQSKTTNIRSARMALMEADTLSASIASLFK